MEKRAFPFLSLYVVYTNLAAIIPTPYFCS